MDRGGGQRMVKGGAMVDGMIRKGRQHTVCTCETVFV